MGLGTGVQRRHRKPFHLPFEAHGDSVWSEEAGEAKAAEGDLGSKLSILQRRCRDGTRQTVVYCAEQQARERLGVLSIWRMTLPGT